MAVSQVLHGFWREVVYLWRSNKLPRDFFEVSQIWLYRGETTCINCLHVSSVDAMSKEFAGASRVLQAIRTGFSVNRQTLQVWQFDIALTSDGLLWHAFSMSC